MAPMTTALTNFLQSLMAIGTSLLFSILAVFQSFFDLGRESLSSILKLGNSIVTLALELFQGVFGFIAANFLALGVLGGAYYLYTLREQKKGQRVLPKKSS
ncbi:hypothetical protein BJ138DRAFT_1006999 [Hygrophoropsis aurantiaca]|uniref:Uncharacterized protein n=1 Tax=Hygrophoropsis aurantiaca TaxID=72124 RepID=A0ACB8ADW5_9AGAM|nr:hypothetical protein BJ138DRAFT_1006999 [Hygrophoropsis aurantiaca]